MTAAKSYRCDDCGREFHSDRALGVHRAAEANPAKKCPLCGRMVKYLDTHKARVHTEDPTKLLQAVTNALDELERLRTEVESLRKELVAERARKT
ncbi:hypothetical protein SEA_RASPUTIA_114 [Microbacterium phage Rasputia]|nr:hypothetical protein SEA_RASPUTIA_114 [Microbacterium phage Rasputia]